nr:MAG TPA: hypothetical protein [Caudoviricetes sp.]
MTRVICQPDKPRLILDRYFYRRGTVIFQPVFWWVGEGQRHWQRGAFLQTKK